MDIHTPVGYKASQVERLLRSVAFYRQLQRQDPDQFENILAISRMVELKPGEIIMRSGEKGSWLYFLLKGNLSVFTSESEQTPVNTINPGEMFGDLAMLSNSERRATVKADANQKGAVLFATNFAQFGGLLDFQHVSLSTKLALYRMIVDGIRWKLELNRSAEPDNAIAKEILSIKLYLGPKNTNEELVYLEQQAKQLAELLVKWNSHKSQDRGLFVSSADDTLVVDASS